jgi:hypothetical protein
MVKIPPKNINPNNSYSVPKIFVLKIKKDGSTNNKVIAWKPCCHQTDTNHDDRPRTAKCLSTEKDVESTNGSPLVVIMTNQHVDGMTQCKHSGNLYFVV